MGVDGFEPARIASVIPSQRNSCCNRQVVKDAYACKWVARERKPLAPERKEITGRGSCWQTQRLKTRKNGLTTVPRRRTRPGLLPPVNIEPLAVRRRYSRRQARVVSKSTPSIVVGHIPASRSQHLRWPRTTAKFRRALADPASARVAEGAGLLEAKPPRNVRCSKVLFEIAYGKITSHLVEDFPKT